MTKKLPTIIFFGNERLATGISTSVPTLKGLVKAGYNVAGLIINQEKAKSRKFSDPEIVALAKTLDIPVWYARNEADLIINIDKAKPSIGVLVAYGRLVSSEIINLFPCGIINIHPSLLPKHRGPTPIESAILAGETKTGVSLMKLVSKMDAGPVYAQCTTYVPKNVSKQLLANQLLDAGAEILVKHLPDIINNSLLPKPQDEKLATYDSLINKQDGLIDWRKPAEQLSREIRAYYGWPKSLAKIGSQLIIITAADVIETTGKPGEYRSTKDSLVVFAGQKALSIKRVQPISKNEMSIEAFLAGYKL